MSAAIGDTRCVADPATSTGSQSGVTAVAVGEQVRVATEVDLEPGLVFQDILANPDGSTYVSSWLGVTPADGAVVADVATLQLTIDGVAQPLTAGTLPAPGGFVLDTSTPESKVYFPGDPAVLTAPTGSAAPSYTVPDGGQTFRLTYLATVGALDAGEVTPAASCQAAISYGEANAAIDTRSVSVAALGLDLTVAKTADLPVLAPSSTVTYSIEVAVPVTDASGEIRTGTAYDTVVSDDLPDGLNYVAGSASHGGSEAGGVLTWTIAELEAGGSITLTYQMQVPADAVPGTAYTNAAEATTTGQPGDVAGERSFDAAGDSVTLANGASAPTITKASDVAVAGTGQTVTYTVGITWPAGSTWHDITITDLLPDGLTLVDAGSFACPAVCPSLIALDPAVGTDASTRFGWYLPQFGPLASPETWEWTYTARMTGESADGSAVPRGSELANLAEVRFNLIPRLGGVVPNLGRLNPYDGTVGAVAAVTFDRPVVAIDKATPAGPIDPDTAGITYTVTLTNTGGVDATGVTFRDPGPSSSGIPLGAISPGSVSGATYSSATGTFTVGLVPDGESRTVTYRVVGAPANAVAVDADYVNTATLTGYRDPAGNVYSADAAGLATVAVVQPDLTVDKQRLSASPIAGTDGELIAYRITIVNTGEATAYAVAGADVLGFEGTTIPGACTGGMTLSAAGLIELAVLAPGAQASCDYTVELDGDQPEGPLDNTATVTWRNGFGQASIWTPAAGTRPFSANAGATTTVVHPQLALVKSPEADTPGNVIQNGQTGTFTIAVANVAPVTARNVVLSDVLPAGLTLEGIPSVATTPAGIANTVDGGLGDAAFTVTFPALAPGEAAQVTIPVRHDGVEPADEVLVNSATLTADGLAAPLTDTGALVWVPAVAFPTVAKTAEPTSVGIGGEVTWTVTATVTENIVDVFDVAIVDTLPRGMTFGSYGTATCVSGPLCATVPDPEPLTPAVLATGETRVGWFIGDVPEDLAPTAFTFTFTSTIAETYTGTGTPPAGTSVTDTFLVNRVQPWLTISEARDRYDDGSLPDLSPTSLLDAFERRGPVVLQQVHVVTPRVIVDKVITNLGDPLEWSTGSGSGTGWMADAGETIGYELTIANSGGATAYDIEISDSMGQPASDSPLLRDVVITELPAGVTVVDGWTLADPDVILHVDELAPGAQMTVAYTGEVAPSAELVPGFGGDNRDVALIRNTVEVPIFRSAPGGGLLFVDSFTTGIEAYVYTPSPHIPAAAACVGGAQAPAGTTSTFSIHTTNGAPPFGERFGTLLTTGFPSDPAVGVGHGATLTVALAANVRYVPGTARVNGATVSDPGATVDVPASRQTLTFDLGDVPQNHDRNVTFQVRTIADGVRGGMSATLTMDDASGSPSRGTAVPGASYVYQTGAQRGCGDVTPLTITKAPDLRASYEGQKQFKVGETIRWFGAVFGANAPYHDAEFVDTLPAGIDYLPGTASFTVFPMTGPAQVASAANGNLTEVVTPLPDGRTTLHFSSALFAEFERIDYRYDSLVGADAIVGATATNVINLLLSDDIVGDCPELAAAVCDSGQVQIISSATPTITKAVDHSIGPWGDTFTYTVEVTFPGSTAYFDAYIGDRGDYPRALDPDGPAFANATIECITGCPATDPAPITLPVWTADPADPEDPDELARAWFLGDLAAQIDARTYRITYEHTFADVAEYLAEFGEPASTQEHVNEAVAGWNDADVIGTPAVTPASSRQFAILTSERGIDDAAVTLATPELTVAKVCEALDGTDDLGTTSSFGVETTGAIPNFRCVLTATNTTDPTTPITIVDPVLLDAVPTQSQPDDPPRTPVVPPRPVVTQLTFWESDEPLVEVLPTEIAPAMTPARVSALQVTAEGLALAPGESFTVTVDLRVSTDAAFRNDATRKLERSTNSVAAQSYADVEGNLYQGADPATWDLVIVKPTVTVSQRAWADAGYAESLADGRPTACMAAANKPEPSVIGERIRGEYHERCTDYKDARGHETAANVGSEYVRTYGDAAPDVVLGVTSQVTWAVDVAVQRPDAVSTVSLVDQIPYGFEYVPGSARLATWSETGTAHVPLVDPVIGPSPALTCTRHTGFYGGGIAANVFNVTAGATGQLPWTPLTWTFADGAPGAAGAFWDDGLSYLHGANRHAAGVLPEATPFDRMVRVVFEVRPSDEFADCLQTPAVNTAFRSRVEASAATDGGAWTSVGLGWVQGVELTRVDKSPDGAIAPDGTTATYAIDVTITDQTRLDSPDAAGDVGLNAARSSTCNAPPLAQPTRTPWVGLGDLSRNGVPIDARFMSTYHGNDFSSRLVVTDTLVDDGGYVLGSATFEMFDPWGRPFAGHLASEDVELVTVDGRAASRVTWTFDYYPSPFHGARSIATFPCAVTDVAFVSYPSSLHVSVPLPIPDDTADGTPYPNSASARIDHFDAGTLVRSHGATDDALITVRNPLPPPPTTKTAVPDEVAPGATFEWVVEAQLQADAPWFDLGWTDTIPASMEFLGYGAPECVESGTSTPCVALVAPAPLDPVDNPDGSTTVGWFVGDVLGTPTARTVRMPLRVRFVGDEVAGEQLVNVVTGFSNDDDIVDQLTRPADPDDFFHVGEPVAGVADVVEPSLTITKIVTSDPGMDGAYQTGDNVTYEVTVTNAGGATAFDVPVSDTPAAFLASVVTTHPTRSKGWTTLDPRVEWFLPTLAPGASVTLDVAGVVADGYLDSGIGELTNTATVDGYTSQPVSAETGRAYPAEQASVTVPLVAPNLTVAKFAGDDCTDAAQVYAPGEPVSWCVVVENTGDAPAFNVTLTDVLPVGWTYEAGSAEINGSGGEPTETTTGAGAVRLLWSLGSEVTPGAAFTVIYRTIGPAGGGLVDNRAIVDSTLEDGSPVPGGAPGFRGVATAAAAALGAGLQLSKLPDSQRVECDAVAGCPLEWELVVVNADELDLTGATVTDYLPAGLTFDTATIPAGWSAPVVGTPGSGPGNTTPVTWTHPGSFASGSTASFAITALVPPGGAEREYLNHAEAIADGVPAVENQALAEVYSVGSLGDFVWNDLDQDGRQDPGEPWFPGVAVQLYDAGDQLVAATVTDVDGAYLFADLAPGSYRVRFLVPDGWTVSPADVGDDATDNDAAGDGWTPTIDLPSGADQMTWDAGLFVTPVPSYVATKTASTDTAKAGDVVTYQVTLVNTGGVPFTAGSPASFSDDLSDVLDDAAYNGDADNGATYNEPTLSWSGPLPVGGSVTITYSVTIDTSVTGDHELTNAVVTAPVGGCQPGSTNPSCTVVTPVQAYTVGKRALTTDVSPGATVDYEITVRNTGRVAYTVGAPARFTDDLSAVLDDAAYNGDHTASGGTVGYTEPVLSWSGPLAVGATATIAYSVTLDASPAGDGILTNTVVTPIGGNCATGDDARCQVVLPGPELEVTKTASAATARPGQTITYTIQARNTGTADFTAGAPAIFTDNLTGVLDDATYQGDATGDAIYTAPQLTWSTPLAAGQTATVTYSVTVNTPAAGDRVLRNAVVTPPDIRGNCLASAAGPQCRTTTPVAQYQVVKQVSTANPRAGDRVSYTITVTNTGAVDYTAGAPASFTDDLSGVLDDATYNGDVTGGAIVSDSTLTWVGPLAVGVTTTIRYSVTVDNSSTGDGRLVNVVITPVDGTADPGGCPPEATREDCHTLSLVMPPGPGQPVPQPPPSPPAEPNPVGELPSTGGGRTTGWLTRLGLLAVAIGVVLVGTSRRHRGKLAARSGPA